METDNKNILSAEELEHTIGGILPPMKTITKIGYITTLIFALLLCALSAFLMI